MDCPEVIDATISSERVYLQGIQSSKLNFINTKSLTLNRVIGDCNLIPEVDGEGLNELTVLDLSYSDSVEYLVDTTKEHVLDTAFTNLVELTLLGMGGLKRFCNGKYPKRFLQNLEKLRVERCDMLEEVFQYQKHLLKGSPYFNLQSLKVVEIFDCERLKSLFSASLIQSLLLLEELQIEDCYQLKTDFTELENDGGETESSSHNLHLHPLCLPRLRTLRVSDCASLEYVLPITLVRAGLPQLEYFEIRHCGGLKTVFAVLENDGGETESSSQDLHPLCLPRLTTLHIEQCGRLEYVLPITLAQSGLPQLEKLEINYCGGLKTVFAELENDGGETKSSGHVLHPLCLPRLTKLFINDCERLEYVLPITLAQGLP
ncbi:hypothetical protein PTKIN_Ptkin14bG0128400 [Pterospermum kingtungense]